MKITLSIFTLGTVLLINTYAIAADKVVIIPLQKCADGLTNCSGDCVDTMNNPSFCGDCTTDCGADNYCGNGTCKGIVGEACTKLTECVSGLCKDNVCITGKIVFISSAYYTGDLGGLTGADNKCQGLADEAGLKGTFKAWLSDDTTTSPYASPSSRFNQAVVPYYRVDLQRVAKNWDDLTDENIENRININELGAPIPFNSQRRVHTNTLANGWLYFTANDCLEWTTANSTISSSKGNSDFTDSKWSWEETSNCSNSARLYCFQQ